MDKNIRMVADYRRLSVGSDVNTIPGYTGFPTGFTQAVTLRAQINY